MKVNYDLKGSSTPKALGGTVTTGAITIKGKLDTKK